MELRGFVLYTDDGLRAETRLYLRDTAAAALILKKTLKTIPGECGLYSLHCILRICTPDALNAYRPS